MYPTLSNVWCDSLAMKAANKYLLMLDKVLINKSAITATIMVGALIKCLSV